MTCILFISLASLAVFIFSRSAPVYIPHIDVQQQVDIDSDILYVEHRGGETIDTRDILLIVSFGGNKKTLSSPEISDCLGKSYWEAGDVLRLNVYEKWGLRLDKDDCVDVFLVDRDSNKLIQRGSLPMENRCRDLLELNSWYFFTNVTGDDSDEVILSNLQDCGISINFTPAAPGDPSGDVCLGKDNVDYSDVNSFYHDLKNDALDLTFGFDENALKGFRTLPHNATIFMIYGLQSMPTNSTLETAGESMPIFNGNNSGTKNWYIYNKTVPLNISDINGISTLTFDLHLDAENKDIDIDYLAVYLS